MTYHYIYKNTLKWLFSSQWTGDIQTLFNRLSVTKILKPIVDIVAGKPLGSVAISAVLFLCCFPDSSCGIHVFKCIHIVNNLLYISKMCVYLFVTRRQRLLWMMLKQVGLFLVMVVISSVDIFTLIPSNAPVVSSGSSGLGKSMT